MTGCGSTAAPQTSLGTITITGFATSTYLPFWVIMDRHLDTQNGFTLKYINTAGGGALYLPLASGEADASTILPPLAIQYDTTGFVSPGKGPIVPVPAFWVKATPDHPGTAIVARSNITRISQLAGLTIATHNVVSGFFIQAEALLERNGLRVGNGSGEVHTDTMPFSAVGAALKRNIVQAGVVDYITALEITSLGEGHILTDILGAPPFNNYDEDTFVFNRSFLKHRPDAAVALMRATLEADAWIESHVSAAKQILLQNLQISQSEAKPWLSNYNMDGFQTNFELPVAQSTVPQDEQMLLSLGIIKSPVDVSAIYEYGNLVARAQQSWDKAPGA